MKPIIFSTPMIQAILEGRKTQTRRIVKINGQPITSLEEYLELSNEGLTYYSVNSISGYYIPPYQPGDILWVREAWAEARDKYYYKADKKCIGFDDYGCLPRNVEYHETCDICEYSDGYIKWRSPRFMPKAAARIFLLVKGVRVERVQDISFDDCISEGINLDDLYQDREVGYPTARELFRLLWDSINAKRGYGWDTNPWVWVVEFERISKVEALLKESEVEGG